MATVTVRDRTDDDLDAAAAALVEVHRVDGYPVEGVDDPHAWLQPPGLLHAWVGVLEGQVVRHAVVTTPKPGDAAVDAWTAQGGELDRMAVGGRLFVHPEGRGHDLGRQLASAITDWSAEHGYDLVGDVMEKDHAALRIYRALGWQQIGTAMHDTGHGTEIPALLFVHQAPNT
jgi:GNAT superfamily N-acetyltransferase